MRSASGPAFSSCFWDFAEKEQTNNQTPTISKENLRLWCFEIRRNNRRYLICWPDRSKVRAVSQVVSTKLEAGLHNYSWTFYSAKANEFSIDSTKRRILVGGTLLQNSCRRWSYYSRRRSYWDIEESALNRYRVEENQNISKDFSIFSRIILPLEL